MLSSQFKGEVKVFRHENDNGKISYSVQIGKKNMEGGFDNAWLYARFKKGVDIPNRSTINVTNGWLDFYLNKENKPVFGIFISEFDGLEEDVDGWKQAEDAIPF